MIVQKFLYTYMYTHRIKPNNGSTDMSLTDTGPGSPTDGLLSKAKRRLRRSNSRSIYGTNAILSLTDDEVDSDDESGLCSSGGSNFTIS